MKLFSHEHRFQYNSSVRLPSFRYPWDGVSIANWIKYPNENTPHVVHVDYLSRRIDPATGILHTERLLTCRQNVPSFLRRLFCSGDDTSLFLEASEVDPKGRTLILRSQNITFGHLLTVEELCRYAPDPADPKNHTLFTQEARIKSFTGWRHVRDTIEEFCARRFFSNAQKGRIALEHAIDRLYADTKECLSKIDLETPIVSQKVDSDH